MEFARLETGQGTLVLRSPLDGVVVVANPRLEDNPVLINEDPYTAGWLLLVHPGDMVGYKEGLLDAEAYMKWVEKEAIEHALAHRIPHGGYSLVPHR